MAAGRRHPARTPLDLSESVRAVAVHGNVIVTAARADIALHRQHSRNSWASCCSIREQHWSAKRSDIGPLSLSRIARRLYGPDEPRVLVLKHDYLSRGSHGDSPAGIAAKCAHRVGRGRCLLHSSVRRFQTITSPAPPKCGQLGPGSSLRQVTKGPREPSAGNDGYGHGGDPQPQPGHRRGRDLVEQPDGDGRPGLHLDDPGQHHRRGQGQPTAVCNTMKSVARRRQGVLRPGFHAHDDAHRRWCCPSSWLVTVPRLRRPPRASERPARLLGSGSARKPRR